MVFFFGVAPHHLLFSSCFFFGIIYVVFESFELRHTFTLYKSYIKSFRRSFEYFCPHLSTPFFKYSHFSKSLVLFLTHLTHSLNSSGQVVLQRQLVYWKYFANFVSGVADFISNKLTEQFSTKADSFKANVGWPFRNCKSSWLLNFLVKIRSCSLMRAGSCGMSVLLIFTRVPDAIFYKDTEPFAQLAIIYGGEMLTPVSHSCGIFFPKSLFACVTWLIPALLVGRRRRDSIKKKIWWYGRDDNGWWWWLIADVIIIIFIMTLLLFEIIIIKNYIIIIYYFYYCTTYPPRLNYIWKMKDK